MMSVFETKITHSYNQQDIQQILNLALARQEMVEEFSREQLVEIAAELGISIHTLLEAEREWLAQQQEQQKRNEFNSYRRSQFKKSFGKFVIVNSFLVAINLINVGYLSWSLYILLFWGLWIALRAWNTYQIQGEDYERAFQKWKVQNQVKQIAQSTYTSLKNWIQDQGLMTKD
ncbi:2TM domain-containing protein [Moorena sp. SIO3I8]|uniref:2TM domain-containing protein n=2 Tax=unclassified Moorena TaxID=2683338 RepID=UPI003414FD36